MTVDEMYDERAALAQTSRSLHLIDLQAKNQRCITRWEENAHPDGYWLNPAEYYGRRGFP